MSQDSSLANLLKSLDSQIKYNQVSMASWGGQKSFKKAELPTVDFLLNNASKLTKQQNKRNEMIDDYLKKQRVPIEIDGVSYKYHNIPAPELEQIENLLVNFDDGSKKEMTPEEFFNLRDEEIKEYFLNEKENMKREIFESDMDLKLLEGNTTALKQEMDYLTRTLVESGLPEDELEANAKQLRRLERILNRNELFIEQQNKKQKDFMKNPKAFVEKLNYEKEIKEKKNELDEKKERLRQIMMAEDQALEELKERRAQYHNISKQNKEKLKSYQDELNKLNNGVFSSQQNPNEPDEAYLERLQTMAETPFDNDNTQQLAILEQKKDLRENLKEIIRDNALINQVVNKLSSENNLLVFELNKTFEEFKRKFLKKYGYDNKNVKDFDILKEIVNHLRKVDEEQQLAVVKSGLKSRRYDEIPVETQEEKSSGSLELEEIYPEGEVEEIIFENPALASGKSEIEYSISPDKQTLKLKSLNNGQEIFLRYKEGRPAYKEELVKTEEEISSDSRGKYSSSSITQEKLDKPYRLKQHEDPIVLYSFIGSDRSFFRCPPFTKNGNIFDIIIKRFQITKDDLFKFFKMNNRLTDFTREIGNKRLVDVLQKNFGIKSSTREGYLIRNENPLDTFTMVGEGTKNENKKNEYKKNDKVKFGSIILMLNKLFYDNILSICRPDGVKINGWKNKHVSDEFVMCVVNILDNENYHKELNKLSSVERVLLDNLLKIANLHKKVITGSGKDSINKLKSDLEILEGEIQAGNNNESLKQKLHDILHKLAYFKVISLSQANKHYKEYVKNFF